MNFARGNHGIIPRHVAHGMGVSDRMLRTREDRGLLTQILPNIFWLRAVPFTWLPRLKAATEWAAPAAASHRAAAGMLGLEGFPAGPVEITTSRRVRSPVDFIAVHAASAIPRPLIRYRAAIPYTSVEKTLFDLGAVCSSRKVEDALDDALRRRATTLDRLQAHLDSFGRHGRRGAGVLRGLLEDRLDNGYTHSRFEKALLRLVRRFKLPAPDRQHPVRLQGHSYDLDFAYPSARVGIEAWSYAFHSKRDDWEHDQERHALLTTAGWLMLYVTYRRLASHPESVAGDIRRALSGRALF